jgi:shikimate kinase
MTISDTFLDRFIKQYPKITLIGMSGLGKSHWSKVLERYGYTRFCCDDVITDRLLGPNNKYNEQVEDIGEWMGFPYEPGYKNREKAYLSLETDILREFIARLDNSGHAEKIVIDTTGSAPYAGDEVMERLGELSCIIYLAASKEYYSEMLEQYIMRPRPVLWSDKFEQRPFESIKDGMKRSYEELLQYRDLLYRKWAHYTIPYEVHHS